MASRFHACSHSYCCEFSLGISEPRAQRKSCFCFINNDQEIWFSNKFSNALELELPDAGCRNPASSKELVHSDLFSVIQWLFRCLQSKFHIFTRNHHISAHFFQSLATKITRHLEQRTT